MERLKIRPMTPGDSARVAEIVHEAPQAAEWKTESYAKFPGWVAEREGEIAGFVLVRPAADEMEILNIAVIAAERRRGIGSRLLSTAFDYGRQQGARRVFLEVRGSNERAQQFYRQRGFEETGRRPRYYHDPEEDALLLACPLEAAG